MIDAGRPCAWCGTTLVNRKGGWKRPDLTGRISREAAHAIHRKYQTGVSARTLGRELHQVLGYKTPQSCADSICRAFHRHGLPTRDRIEATVLASTKNGLSPRDETTRASRRKAAGLTRRGKHPRPRCEATKTQAPGRGDRCTRPSLPGSRFCQSHDPERRQRVVEVVRHARAQQQRQPLVPWSDVHEQLRPWLAASKYPASSLSRATGVPHGTCSRLLQGQRDQITATLAYRLLAPVRAQIAKAA